VIASQRLPVGISLRLRRLNFSIVFHTLPEAAPWVYVDSSAPCRNRSALSFERIRDLRNYQQPVVKVWRRTETGEAPQSQGATTENTGSI
jgi:hypothetical protein